MATASTSSSTATAASGDVIKDRWCIRSLLGHGGFGEVYSGAFLYLDNSINRHPRVGGLVIPHTTFSSDHTNSCCIHVALDMKSQLVRAVKTELLPADKPLLKMEVAVLRELNGQPHIPVFVACGRTPKFNYLVMELLSTNLSELRKQSAKQIFALASVCGIGVQVLEALRTVHEHGILHRDIKPSNCVIGHPPNNRVIYLLDFGLARIYRTETGGVRPPRETAGFRGTSRYASLNVHYGRDMGRCDDLWSFFFMLIELASGGLPWRRLKDKNEVLVVKEGCDMHTLTARLPSEFTQLLDHIASLRYEDRPDYEYCIGLLTSVLAQLGLTLHTLRYEWEEPASLPTAPLPTFPQDTPAPDSTKVASFMYIDRSLSPHTDVLKMPECARTWIK